MDEDKGGISRRDLLKQLPGTALIVGTTLAGSGVFVAHEAGKTKGIKEGRELDKTQKFDKSVEARLLEEGGCRLIGGCVIEHEKLDNEGKLRDARTSFWAYRLEDPFFGNSDEIPIVVISKGRYLNDNGNEGSFSGMVVTFVSQPEGEDVSKVYEGRYLLDFGELKISIGRADESEDHFYPRVYGNVRYFQGQRELGVYNGAGFSPRNIEVVGSPPSFVEAFHLVQTAPNNWQIRKFPSVLIDGRGGSETVPLPNSSVVSSGDLRDFNFNIVQMGPLKMVYGGGESSACFSYEVVTPDRIWSIKSVDRVARELVLRSPAPKDIKGDVIFRAGLGNVSEDIYDQLEVASESSFFNVGLSVDANAEAKEYGGLPVRNVSYVVTLDISEIRSPLRILGIEDVNIFLQNNTGEGRA